MFIKKLSVICYLLSVLCLAGCAGGRDWGAEYGRLPPTGAPAVISQSFDYDVGSYNADVPAADVRDVAVLLPLSGKNASLGIGMQRAIEIAFFQKQPRSVRVTFYDLAGNRAEKINIINNAIERTPDLFIGPIFAEDAALLRDLKPGSVPAITFTSDRSVLGNGVMTFALLPHQAVESAIRHMSNEGVRRTLILAPDNKTGYTLGDAAMESASIYGVAVAGFYYYREGDMNSMKSAALRASMFEPRKAANTRAREILSDMLVRGGIDAADKARANRQLEQLNKTDTIGTLPFDAILFLGDANDSKALASFLRYYDVPNGAVKFFGGATWDNEVMFSDITMTGAKFASLPPMSPDFSRVYESIAATAPGRMDSFAYDAAMLGIAALRSDRTIMAHLMDPSGFRGLDGIVRLRPNGDSERALAIMRLDASGEPKVLVPPAQNFMTPIYQDYVFGNRMPAQIEITDGINPLDYITIPPEIAGRYTAKVYKLSNLATPKGAAAPAESAVRTVLPEDDSEPVESDPDFQPTQTDKVDRVLIEDAEIRTR